MALSNSFKNGLSKYGILLMSAIGLLILLIVSRKGSKASQPPPPIMTGSPILVGPQPRTSDPSPEIFTILTNAGYSPEMGIWWSAISKLETGNFTSELFRKANNLFGMGVPSVRRSLRSGEYTASDAGNIRKFSKYNTTADSVKDLVLYMQSFSYPNTFTTVADLVYFMKSKKYFELDADKYLAGVKRYL